MAWIKWWEKLNEESIKIIYYRRHNVREKQSICCNNLNYCEFFLQNETQNGRALYWWNVKSRWKHPLTQEREKNWIQRLLQWQKQKQKMVSLKSTNRQIYFDVRDEWYRSDVLCKTVLWAAGQNLVLRTLHFSLSLFLFFYLFFSFSIFLNLKILSVTGGVWKLI